MYNRRNNRRIIEFNVCRVSKRFVQPAVLAAIVLLLSVSIATAQERKTIGAVRISEPIVLDGLLRENPWKSAEPLTDFTQRELHEGEPPTEKTEVRVLFDEKNLYIGVVCHDSDPSAIVNKELMWDGDLKGDDYFAFVLDTFSDNRSAFYFSTNPNGALHDGLVKNVEEINDDWDGVWDVRARITEDGWTAEFMIPFMTLRFPKTDVQEWGVNFSRQIRRKNEKVLWTAWGRDDGILQLSKAGRLTGLDNIRRGKRTEIKPYVLGGAEKERGRDVDDTFKYGLDIKYPITSNLTLDFTMKTDFAQVESDKEQINLTRFSLEYPEKRDFFLEGAEIYDFTQGESRYGGVRLFYSRRIGITPDPDRREVPILGGGKLTGKTGPYSIGVMNMQTEEKTVINAEGGENVYPSTNYTVIRIKRDVLDQSYIGFLGTMVNRAGKPDNTLTGIVEQDRFINRQRNHMGAVDFAYNTSTFLGDKNFSVQGYAAASVTPGLDGDNFAGRLSIDYPNDLIDTYFFYHGIGRNFNPEMGFLRRVGIQEYNTKLRYMPRVNIPFIRKLMIEPYSWSYITDMSNRMVTRTFTMRPIGFMLDSGDVFSFERHWHYDYLDYAYNIFGDKYVKEGGYTFEHWFVRYESEKSRAVSFDLMSSWGGYYSGERRMFSSAFTFKINKYLALTPDMTYYHVDLKNDSFIARRASLKLQTNVSTRLTSSTFVQWNNESREAALNFRVHYIPKIGSDLYIAYNQLWDEEEDFITIRNTGVLKVDYLFRF